METQVLENSAGTNGHGHVPPPAPRRGYVGTIIAIALIVTGVVGIRAILQQSSTTAPAAKVAPAPVVTVTTEAAVQRSLPQTLQATGTVYAIDELTLGSEAPGLLIKEVRVDEGDFVKKGQLLVQLNDAVLRAQLKQMQASLAGSVASTEKAIQPNRPQDIQGLEAVVREADATVAQQRANLAQAQAQTRNDEAIARRSQMLLGQGYVTQQDAQNAQTAVVRDRELATMASNQVRAAQEAAEQARQKLALARVGGMRQDVEMARSNTAQIEAQIEQLQAQLAQTRVKAPDDGLILRRDAHVGDITSPGKALFTMVRQGRLELRAQVAEQDLPGLRVGDRVTVTGFGKTVTGKIRKITPSIDSATRLGTARIALPPQSRFLPGMFLRGIIREGTRQALLVPTAAVLGQADGHYVMVYAEGRAHRHDIQEGRRTATSVEILTGLKAGDPVIVKGAGFLKDGDVVRLVQ